MVQEITSKEQYDELIASGRVILIDLYAPWCGPCRTISPTFEKLANEKTVEGAVEFYKLNIDEVPDVARELKVRSIPMFRAFKDGKPLEGSVLGANIGALTNFVQTTVALV